MGSAGYPRRADEHEHHRPGNTIFIPGSTSGIGLARPAIARKGQHRDCRRSQDRVDKVIATLNPQIRAATKRLERPQRLYISKFMYGDRDRHRHVPIA